MLPLRWICPKKESRLSQRSRPEGGVKATSVGFRTEPTNVRNGRTHARAPSSISRTETIRGEIDAVFTEGRPPANCLKDVARPGTRPIIQSALETEVDEFLGRARYQHA